MRVSNRIESNGWYVYYIFIYMFVIDYYMINAMLAFKMHIYAYMHISLFICLFLINSQGGCYFTNEGRDKVDWTRKLHVVV